MTEVTTTEAEPSVDLDSSPSWAPWLLVAIPVVIVLVGAWTYRWVDEDAFINFRIIDNLLAGHGLVYNVGERVEADSDPLWVLSLAGLHVVTPFLALPWLSVLVGLALTAVGFVLGGRAIQRLAASAGEGLVAPLGLLIASVTAGLWEFSTSGLEMGMVIAWLGLSFWLLVRTGLEARGRRWCAVVLGLGPLIRPELALMAVVLVASLLIVALLGDGGLSGGWWRRSLAVVGWAALAPVAFELFRMGYYGLLVANTALAKDAGASWWSQGWVYLWNFLAPYWLVIPLVAGVCLAASVLRRWIRDGDRVAAVLLATPAVAGIADVLYVVHLGGDYMHARLLLPGFVSLCLPLFCSWRMRSTWLVVPMVVIVGWSVVCAGWLRDLPPPPGPLTASALVITNERNTWILATKSAHPITTADYDRALSGIAGPLLKEQANQLTPPSQALAVITDPFASVRTARHLPARSSLPFRLAVNVDGIGVLGDLAGPSVYLFDSFSLANPIGSHFPVRVHARPGHEKYIGPVWMVGRFGSGVPQTISGVGTASQIADVRAAVACGELGRYLHSITAPLTVTRVWSNLVDAIGFTQLRVDPNPAVARAELCG
jgi:arabinofuranosyltransferase